jgi:hypothetical protein
MSRFRTLGRPVDFIDWYFMRCFFLKGGHIIAVQLLNADTDDGLVDQAKAAFYANGGRSAADGYEVWDGKRFIFRFPSDLPTPHARDQS